MTTVSKDGMSSENKKPGTLWTEGLRMRKEFIAQDSVQGTRIHSWKACHGGLLTALGMGGAQGSGLYGLACWCQRAPK